MKPPNFLLLSLIGSFLLTSCGGSQEASSVVTMVKWLDYIACTKVNPIPAEIQLISLTKIDPVKRYCKTTLDYAFPASVPVCGESRYFAHSVVEVLPGQVELAKTIGYSVPVPGSKFSENFDCN